MSNTEAEDQDAPKAATNDYAVGYGRPPLHTRFKKGKSGNPKGRPKGGRNLKTELRDIALMKVPVRDGDTQRLISLVAANLMAQGVKGAKGDPRSSNLFLNQSAKLGLLDPEDHADNLPGNAQQAGAACFPPANQLRLGDVLLDNLNLDLLSRNEQIELSRLADVIDLGGDIFALGKDDFERLKKLVEKGRGKDITPD